MTSIIIDRTDGLSSSTAIKGPCRAATTADIALYGLQTIDGVALADGDRVLVKDQTAGYENGIYVVDTGQWRRAKDFNNNKDVRKGTQVLVTDGTTQPVSVWHVSSPNPVIIGTSAISFTVTVISPAELEALEAAASAAAATAVAASAAALAAVPNAFPLTRTVLKAFATSITSAYLKEPGREGQFTLKAGSIPLSDPNEGVYIASDTAGYYWERLNHRMSFDVRWFGAKLDNSTDDTAAFQAAINFASLWTNTPYSPKAEVYCEPGHIFKTTSQLNASGVGLKITILSQQFYYNTTGYAWFFNELQPAGASSYWDVFMEGIFAQPGIGAFPVAPNASGTVGIGMRAMTFSKFEVRKISGFDFKAVEFDCRGITYPSNNQVIQHNTFKFGQIANNGYGVWALSLDAEHSGFQANRIEVQNIYQNYMDIVDGDATFKASTSNTWVINAMDNATTVGFDSYSPFNEVYIGFTGAPGTSLRLNAGSDFNRFTFANNFSTAITVNENGGGDNNTIECQPPSNLPQTGVTVSNGVDQTNNFGCPISVVVPVSGGGTYQLYLTGPSGTVTASSNLVANGPITIHVKHGWKWKLFTTGGTVNYGTASIFAA